MLYDVADCESDLLYAGSRHPIQISPRYWKQLIYIALRTRKIATSASGAYKREKESEREGERLTKRFFRRDGGPARANVT